MNKRFWAMVTGREPADVRIDNVRIVDVFSGEIREGSVSIGEGRILGFGQTSKLTQLMELKSLKMMDG